jgi:tetratricopeptide (TPR) repeat protein
MTEWAAFLARTPEAAEHAEQIRYLVDGAVHASPLDPASRLAAARLDALDRDRDHDGNPEQPGPPLHLGLSRDPVALAWTARHLLKAGQAEAALPLFRQALELATQPDFSPRELPEFHDDPSVRRYLLPGESLVRSILRDLATDAKRPFAEWANVLPRDTVAPLVAARMLREQGRIDADAAIDRILNDARSHDPSPPASDADAANNADSIRLAVRAEAFAMKSRWKEARQEYRRALGHISHDAIRRSWWFNLADIALRLNDDNERREALKAVLASATGDEISRRASDLQRDLGVRATSSPSTSSRTGPSFPRAN